MACLSIVRRRRSIVKVLVLLPLCMFIPLLITTILKYEDFLKLRVQKMKPGALLYRPSHKLETIYDDSLSWVKDAFIKVPADGTIPVIVVEEHHEVLPYWFDAVKKGLVKKQGVTLIHIDGHSDMAPPIFYEEYPLHRHPASPIELRAMMQRNDAFIMGAANSGLLERIVWVYPSWDPSLDMNENHHVINRMDIGRFTKYYDAFQTKVSSMCICVIETTTDKLDTSNCMGVDLNTNDLDFNANLTRNECIVNRSIVFEQIRDDEILKQVMSGKFDVSESSQVILDIDEDFYGCESAIQPFLDVGGNFKLVTRINSIIGKIFCPINTEIELRLDQFISDIIDLLIKRKNCAMSSPSCVSSINAMLNNLKSQLTNKGALHSILCDRSSMKSWSSLLKMVDKFTIEHLRVLKELGFCLRTTQKAYDSDMPDEENFLTCHGMNVPNQTVVHLHTPHEQEITKRSKDLTHLLKYGFKNRNPSLITVCRSMRDGYTPRKYFERIESDIMRILKETFTIDIKYDADLMGGERGWPARHQNKYYDR